MSRTRKIFLGTSAALVVLAALVVTITGCLSPQLRYPTLEEALSSDLVIALWNDRGDRGPVQQLCRNDKAGGVTAESFLKDFNGDPSKIPRGKVVITSRQPIDDSQGQATARVTGLPLSRARYEQAREVALLPGAPACTGTVSFSYRFYLDDNGRAAVRRCEIRNLVVTGH